MKFRPAKPMIPGPSRNSKRPLLETLLTSRVSFCTEGPCVSLQGLSEPTYSTRPTIPLLQDTLVSIRLCIYSHGSSGGPRSMLTLLVTLIPVRFVIEARMYQPNPQGCYIHYPHQPALGTQYLWTSSPISCVHKGTPTFW